MGDAAKEPKIDKLGETNWQYWSFQFKGHLFTKGLRHVINLPEVPEPGEAPPEAAVQAVHDAHQQAVQARADWVEASQLVLGHLTRYVDEDNATMIYSHTCGKAAFETLRAHHLSGSMTSRIVTQKKLNNMRLESGVTMASHWSKMNAMFNRLADLGSAYSEEQKITTILNSVESEYEVVTSGILTWGAAQLTLANVKERLIEAYERKASREQESGLMRGRPSYENLRRAPKQRFSEKEKQLCYHCKEEGHKRFECPKRKKNQTDLRIKLDEKRGNERTGADSEYLRCSFDSFDVDRWVIDSGATGHAAVNRKMFINLRETNFSVVIANGEKVKAHGEGDVEVMLGGEKILLRNVLYVPEMALNLLSVQKLTMGGRDFKFSTSKVHMWIDGDWRLIGSMLRGHYRTLQNNIVAGAAREIEGNCIHDWHRVLAHRNMQDLKNMVKNHQLEVRQCNCDDQCESCIVGKMARKKFPKKAKPTKEILDIVVSDVCGPMQTEGVGRCRYFVTFIDIHSGYCEVIFIRQKSEVVQETIRFVERMKTQLGRKPKIIRSDRAKEYLDQRLQNYLRDEGIRTNLTVGYCPEQNGVAERRNRTLMEAARTIRSSTYLTEKFWTEAVRCANYVQNRTARKDGKTPVEMMFGEKPEYKTMREFGSSVYVMIPYEKRRKLEEKATLMTFIGYDEESKGYRVTDGKKIFVTREVEFVKKPQAKPVRNPEKGTTDGNDEHSESDSDESDDDNHPPAPAVPQPAVIEEDDDYESAESEVSDEPAAASSEESSDDEPEVRRSTRGNFGQPPVRFNDYQMFPVKECEESGKDPQTFKQAMESRDADAWKKAIEEELNAMKENKTWEIVDLPRNQRTIGSKWVFKTKYDEQGNVEKRKARLVAQGFSQRHGIDYIDVYAPVARSVTLKMLLSAAGRDNLKVLQYDVKSAFLNGDLKEEVFMRPPPGVETRGGVCKLIKSLYGLKQAANVWNLKIHESLIKRGFVQNETDNCLYMYNSGGDLVHLLIHVDDILAATNNERTLSRLMNDVGKDFELKCIGEAKEYLGIKLERDEVGNFRISQPQFIQSIIDEAGMIDARESKYPVDIGYYSLDGDELKSNEEFRKLIGMLLYLAVNTRPDIAAAVTILSQKVIKPRNVDLTEARRIVRYLKGTIDSKLQLSTSKMAGKLEAYSDSDWANDRSDRKSNTGWLVTMNGGAISWSCRKQSMVTMSSAEAEYVALTETTKEVVWIKRVAQQFGFDSQKSTKIRTDSQSAIAMVGNHNFSSRTKHIDVRFHYIREQKEKKTIELVYCPTETNIADLMTKPLGGVRTKMLRELAGLNRDELTVEEEC
jgi:transposase InsO family protein/predicted aspartyl protease